jgi:hypothetical protein
MLLLVGAGLAVVGVLARTQGRGAAARAEDQVEVRFETPPPAGRVYEGVVKDAGPAWGYLVLTVGKGKEARDVRFDILGARIGAVGQRVEGPGPVERRPRSHRDDARRQAGPADQHPGGLRQAETGGGPQPPLTIAA